MRYAEHELAHEIVGLLLDLGAGCGGPLLVAPVNLSRPDTMSMTATSGRHDRAWHHFTLLQFLTEILWNGKKVVAKLSAWGL